MRDRVLWGVIAAAAVGILIFGYGLQGVAQSNGGPRWWGSGMMGRYGYGMGPWMMGGYGGYNCPMGPWATDQRWSDRQAVNLSAGDVRNQLEHWLAWQGNPYVKLGKISEKNADTIVADIVTTDSGALVEHFAVDHHTGLFRPSGD